MKGELTAINGAELFWESAGEGSAVVLIHAGTADSRMWDDLFSRLSEDFRSVRYDLRGFGRSSFPGGPYSHAADLDALFRTLGIDSAAVIGTSLGGQIAIDFSLVYPLRVTRLLLAASALGGYQWSEEVQGFGAAEDAALDAGDVDKAVELNLRMWVDGPSRGSSAVSATVRERVREMQRNAFEKQLRAYEQQSPPPSPTNELQPPTAARLTDIDVPTLVVVGDKDALDILEIADQLAKEIPQARKVVIPGTAHMLSLEKPEEFSELVVAFLEQSG